MISIILADDHPLTRDGIKAYLLKEKDFIIAGEYADGLSAWEAIQKIKPDIALLDIRMPNIDGISIARKIKENHLPVSALMLTSYDSNQYVMAALRAGARGYLLKTALPQDISRAIRTIYGGGFYIDQEMSNIAFNQENDFSQDRISSRELEVLRLAAKGKSSKEIAAQLYISDRTVQTHLASIYEKLGANNKTEAMLISIKYGIVTLDELLD